MAVNELFTLRRYRPDAVENLPRRQNNLVVFDNGERVTHQIEDEQHMKPVILVLASTILLSACASRTGTDAAIGGALGGGTGLLLGGTTGAVAGGLLGAGAGALIGQMSEGDSTQGNHNGRRKSHDDDD